MGRAESSCSYAQVLSTPGCDENSSLLKHLLRLSVISTNSVSVVLPVLKEQEEVCLSR